MTNEILNRVRDVVEEACKVKWEMEKELDNEIEWQMECSME